MGCILSKSSKVFSKVHRTSSYTASDKNGIARVKKIHINQDKRGGSAKKNRKDEAQVSNGSVGVSGSDVTNERLRLQPPPPPPSASPSPPSSPSTPRGHSFNNLQDAADLEPAPCSGAPVPCPDSPFPSELTVSDMTDSQTAVTTSRVKVGGLWKTSSSLNHDISVEDLDTRIQDNRKLSGPRYRFSTDERINPVTTDVLLPHRKKKQKSRDRPRRDTPWPVIETELNEYDVIGTSTCVETPITQMVPNIHDVTDFGTRSDTSSPITLMGLIEHDVTGINPRANTPVTQMELTGNDVTAFSPCVNTQGTQMKRTEHDDAGISSKSNSSVRKTASAKNDVITFHSQCSMFEDLTSDSRNLSVDKDRIIIDNSQKKQDTLLPLDKNKHGTKHTDRDLSESTISYTNLELMTAGIRATTPSKVIPLVNSGEKRDREKEMRSDSRPLTVHMSLYEQNLQQSRNNSRKRKHSGNRKTDRLTRNKSSERNFDGFLKGNLSSASRLRLASRTSTWTLDSKESFGSTETLHSCDMIECAEERPEVTSERCTQPYSYLTSSTTPVSFTSINMEAPTDIIDLEEQGEDDAWLSSGRQEQTFDAWYGMKPYTVYPSSNPNDSSTQLDRVVTESGPSSSAINTKQKLLHAKYARRPKSESVLSIAGRPPLPPGRDVRVRPTSDTGRREQPFSRYFASNVDMHF